MQLICNRSLTSTILLIASLLLLLSSTTARASDLHRELIGNVPLKPFITASVMNAASEGDLYHVEVDTSNVSFMVNHFPFSTVVGHFNEFSGGLTLPEGDAQARHALFIIKVDSVTTGDSDLNNYLKSSVFFNAEQYPVIIFVSTGFEWINESTARLIGNLTLHGKTRPLVFYAHIDTTENIGICKNQKMTMNARAEIQRSDFGMNGLQVLVSDTVKFDLKIKAYRAPG
jgi:polyisoprenoid-binding protein YceI